MPNWSGVGSGALGGAAAGSTLGWPGALAGGVLGALPGLFDDSGDQAQDQYQQQLDLYNQVLNGYKGPDGDPGYQQQLAGLQQQANGGLSAQDRAAFLEQYNQAANMAHGQEGAIEQQALMRGGGVSNSGQSAALAAQAGQAGANRLQQQGMGQAGIAAQRAVQARMGYLQQIQNNAASMNNYRMAAAGMVGGAHQNMANFYGAQGQANQYGWENAVNGVGNAAMWYANHQGTPAAAQSPGGATQPPRGPAGPSGNNMNQYAAPLDYGTMGGTKPAQPGGYQPQGGWGGYQQPVPHGMEYAATNPSAGMVMNGGRGIQGGDESGAVSYGYSGRGRY